MKKIQVMVNGLPGNMAALIAKHVASEPRMELVPHSLTGPDIPQTHVDITGISVALAAPPAHKETLARILDERGLFIVVDYSHPSAVNPNAALYCEMAIPFVMGTTGGDRASLAAVVENSSICAVIAPNMAKQIVGLQAMMEYAAERFPGLFEGYSLEIVESHQKGKADTSGTAKAMVGCFNKLGIPFEAGQIRQIRDPEAQEKELGVPPEHLGGHGWHTYTLLSPDKTVKFAFTHNVNGREIYWGGTVDAIVRLHKKMLAGCKGKVYSMIDVLSGS